MPATDTAPPAAVHVDLDGARHIFRAHGWRYDGASDPLFVSGLTGALDAFSARGIRATLFVIAEDLQDPAKRDLIRAAVDAGHEVASHSDTHERLTAMPRQAKQREIAGSRERLSAGLGVEVRGFRAPAFWIDRECLELIDDAGYVYDSSMLGRARARDVAAADRVEPHRPLDGRRLIELPLPRSNRVPLPFHPSYSLVVGDWLFRQGVRAWRERNAAMILLFHLTDFADPLPPSLARGWKQRLFTLSYQAASRKRARSGAMLDAAASLFTFTSTTDLIAHSAVAPRHVRTA
jgi:peptidoglycan/xylan/chitin deacetylase (PgdA/CDA1 family)